MYNKFIMMGRLTKDPELRTTQSGVTMCRFSIAVERQFSKQGEERQTDFFNMAAWKQTAEFVSKYFSKGKMIHVEGTIQNNNYTDQNGVKHYSDVYMVQNVSFCGDKSGDQGQQAQTYRPAAQPAQVAAATPAAQTAVQKPQPVELGDLDDFEEILSDGEVPF
jgi:single-strand DNA-binding protein